MSYPLACPILKKGFPKRDKAEISNFNTTLSSIAPKVTGNVCNKDYMNTRHDLNLCTICRFIKKLEHCPEYNVLHTQKTSES